MDENDQQDGFAPGLEFAESGDAFDTALPLSTAANALLRRAVLIGQGRERTPDAPYADWKSLLAAFIIDDTLHADTALPRWLAQQGKLNISALLRQPAGRTEREARARIRASAMPEPVKDGPFTRSVHDVLALATKMSTGEVDCHHVFAAMVLPENNSHAADLAAATDGDRGKPGGTKYEEVRRLMTIYALDHIGAYDEAALHAAAPEQPYKQGAEYFHVEPSASFLESCAQLDVQGFFPSLEVPYVAAWRVLRPSISQLALRDFLSAQTGTWPVDVENTRAISLAGQPRQPAPLIWVAERARYVARAASGTEEPDIRHIVAALYAESETLPPRWGLPNNPETLEALVTALQRPGSKHAKENQAWADVIFGSVRRVPVVRDLGTKDLLDFDRFAKAFALVIADKEMSPPLALGVFGAWGSGKSMFMGMVENHVRSLAKRAAAHDAEQFCKGVVQIRFNAWHYSDINLWASIVSHIFGELDAWLNKHAGADMATKMLDRLVTARELTLDATRAYVARLQEQREAQARLETAERERKAALDKLHLGPGDIANIVRETYRDRLDAADKAAAGALGLDQLKDNGQDLLAAIDTLAAQAAQGRALGQALLRRLGGWKPLAGFVTALIAAPLALTAVQQALAAHAIPWLDNINQTAVAIAGFLTTATGVVTWMSARIVPALDRLGKIKSRVDQAIAEKQAALKAPDGEYAAALLAADTAVAQARTAFEAANQRLAEQYAEFTANSGAQRLRRLVQDRAAEGGTYARHLGLIATIHKDFDQLARLLKPAGETMETDKRRAAYEYAVRSLVLEAGYNDNALVARSPAMDKMDLAAPKAEKLFSEAEAKKLLESTITLREASTAADVTIERIVLYIDDLDRCKPDIVMQVLEAVHILLASDLFVVMVGVDMKWLLASIAETSPQLKAGGEGNALDFLEKIFQVPFWVPEMTDGMRTKVISDALGVAPIAPRPRTIAGVSGAAPAQAENSTDSAPALIADASATQPPPLPPPVSLQLAEEEISALVEAARIAGQTPRRLKRLARTYLLLRASLPEAEAERLAVDEDAVRAIAFLLAAASGEPQKWPKLREAVRDAYGAATLADILRGIGFELDAAFTLPAASAAEAWLEAASRFAFVPSQAAVQETGKDKRKNR